MELSKFEEQISRLRAGLEQPDWASFQKTLAQMQRLADNFKGHANEYICIAHLSKDLIDWLIRQQPANAVESSAWKAAFKLTESFLETTSQAAPAHVRVYCVTTLYNGIIKLNGKHGAQILLITAMARFEITDKEVTLFQRAKHLALKTLSALKELTDGAPYGAAACDAVIELQRKLLIQAAGTPTAMVRTAVLDSFREVFGTSMVILQRLFAYDRTKADLLFRTVMETMSTVVRLDKPELVALFEDGLKFVETILAFRESAPEYLKYGDFFNLFRALKEEPYASICQMVQQSVELARSRRPTVQQYERLTANAGTLYTIAPSESVVIKAIILTVTNSFSHLSNMAAELVADPKLAGAMIELVEKLLPFVRHCPSRQEQQSLCRNCSQTRRHLADRLLTMLIIISNNQMKGTVSDRARAPVQQTIATSYTIARVCKVFHQKVTLLKELDCERKQSLLHSTARQVTMFVKHAIQNLRPVGTETNDDGYESERKELITLTKCLIELNYGERFDFLSEMTLLRLLENCMPTNSAWVSSNLSIQLLKLLLTIRDKRSEMATQGERDNAGVEAINGVLRSIVFYQSKALTDDPVRSLTVVQMYTQEWYDRFGFTFTSVPTSDEKLTIIAQEMALVAKYKTTHTLSNYFQQLSQLGNVRQHCLTFGMALYSLGEQEWEKLPACQISELWAGLQSYTPSTVSERIKQAASLAVIGYHRFWDLTNTSKNRLRDIPLEREHLRNGQLDERLLLGNQMDCEAKILEQVDTIRDHYVRMVRLMCDEGFRPPILALLPSLMYVTSLLDGVARYCQVNYYPHRAVELQLLGLLLISQRRAERPYDQCAALGFLLEQHHVTVECLPAFLGDSGDQWPPHAGGDLLTLPALAQRATELLKRCCHDSLATVVPESRRFPFLNLYLSLAVYTGSNSSSAGHEDALELIRSALALADKWVTHGELSDGNHQLVKGRTAQILFRLATESGLPFPPSAPPVAFVKLMLAHFNDLQKVCREQLLILSLAAVETSVAVLQYLLLRYDIGSYIEAFIEQVLKFAIKRGAGLRVHQLLLLYGNINADMQKLDRCEVALRLLNRFLMLHTIGSVDGYRIKSIPWQVATGLGAEPSGKCDQPSVVSVFGAAENEVDGVRKIAKTHETESSMLPLVGSRRQPFVGVSLEDVDEPSAGQQQSGELSIEKYLMFDHQATCGCPYCKSTLHKWMAFRTAALVTRCAVLNGQQPVTQIGHYYQTITDHWLKVMEPLVQQALAQDVTIVPSSPKESWCAAGYRTELANDIMRTMLHRALFEERQGNWAAAVPVYERAVSLWTGIPCLPVDEALLQDLRFNQHLAQSMLDGWRTEKATRKRSSAEPKMSYGDFMAPRKASSSSADVRNLGAEFDKLQLRTPVSKLHSVASRGLPKTVDRVNELLRQAASRRHQQRHGVMEDRIVAPVTTASARKPKTVNIFVDSPPQAPATERRANRREKRTRVKSSTVSPVDQPTTLSSGAATTTTTSAKSTKEEDVEMVSGLAKSAVPMSCTVANTKLPNSGTKSNRHPGDYPSLEEGASAPGTPVKTKAASPINSTVGSPSLNSSFRDVLVLGRKRTVEAAGSKREDHDSSSVIVLLDDSEESAHDVVEASFVDSRSTPSVSNSALALKSYSARRNESQGGTPLTSARRRADPQGSSTSSSSAVKRKPAMGMSKVRLQFDTSSPQRERSNLKKTKTSSTSNSSNAPPSTIPATEQRTTSRRRAGVARVPAPAARLATTAVAMAPVEVIVLDDSVKESTGVPPEENIAKRTRQRRKRINL
ncbi:uncharacterized protein LOC126581404 [Anopheles aquasalis]|uniref:uncharacterized protein LOC126581404 n=1 Tax=Anopheles aquasalis TaxID=42839 RepID=UPI00215B29B7|nr:uncharacterized protein LOC126581404 [Anopheles aquasalis]